MEKTGLLEKIYSTAFNYFHRWYGLAASGVVAIFILLFIYNLMPTGSVPFLWYLLGSGVLIIALVFFWGVHVWHYPKRSKKNLGVAIAIQTENSEEKKFLKNDFLSPFKERIKDLDLPFDVLVLKGHQAETVETNEDARKVLKKTRGHFCIWGSIKKRANAPEGERYIFSLRGNVVHKPIDESQKTLLTNEFNSLLPNRVSFERALQFEGFDFRANQAITALDYITGRAALLSGDHQVAIRLHEPLYQALQSGKNFPVSKNNLEKLLSLEYDQKAYFDFKNSGMEAYTESVEKALQYDRNNYGALLKKAIIEFQTEKPRDALETLKRAKRHSQGAYHWLYSKVFLHFWLGEYGDAIRECNKLKNKNYQGESITAKEVIQFSENLVENFHKPQLYYWMGFVCYVKLGNLAEADRYFQSFIDAASPEMEDLKEKAEGYLATIRQAIGY